MKKKWLRITCAMLALVLAGGAVTVFALQAGGTKYPFRVGYGIISIQPDATFTDSSGRGLSMAGYGNTTKRRADYALSAQYDYDELMATCTAMADEDNNTVLMFTVDLINATEYLTAAIRNRMGSLYGIPENNIFVNASHTHSGPDYDTGETISNKYTNFLIEQLTAVGTAAIEDLTELETMKYGSIEVEQTTADGQVQQMASTRHFTVQYKNTTTGELTTHVTGDNFAPIGYYTGELSFYKRTGHPLASDPTMYMVLFERKDGKQPVVISNFRAHPHTQGGSDETRITADTVGAFRYCMAQEGYLLSHFQGAAGMTNSTSSLSYEMILSQFNSGAKRHARVATDEGWVSGETECFLIQYGKTMVQFAETCLQNNMTEATPHCLSTYRYIYMGPSNKTLVDKYEDAKIISSMWNHPENYYDVIPELEGANLSTTNTLVRTYAAKNYGIRSVYQANAIVTQYTCMDERALDLYALALDDIFCIGMAPNELFHQNSTDFENSAVASGKFKMAMTFGYSNGSDGYLPSLPVWSYSSYETDITHYEKGTGEKVAEAFCDMLGFEYRETVKADWTEY